MVAYFPRVLDFTVAPLVVLFKVLPLIESPISLRTRTFEAISI
jgi:hypothetical protein